MHTNMHPCLCDICLKARDEELHRARKALIDSIPENKVYGHQLDAGSEIKYQLRKEWL